MLICDIKRALQIAGVRVKPMPLSLKRARKITRRNQLLFRDKILNLHKQYTEAQVKFRMVEDPVTGIMFMESTVTTPQGTKTFHEVWAGGYTTDKNQL